MGKTNKYNTQKVQALAERLKKCKNSGKCL